MRITIYCPGAEDIEYQIGQRDTPGMIGPEWTGEVSDEKGTPEQILEKLFRAFNRVDDVDCRRLASWGYKLPSLSSGDVVTLKGKHYLCASAGWKELTPEQYAEFKAQCHDNPRDAWSLAFKMGRS